MSLWHPQKYDQQVNSKWLTAAIHHAQVANAPLYSRQLHLSREGRLNLKRVWWSCIIRDSIMSLAMRRPTFIKRDSFDFDSDCLTTDDFQNGTECPEFYDNEAKGIPLKITALMCRFCCVVTDALNMIYAHLPSSTRFPRDSLQAFQLVKIFRDRLLEWYGDMMHNLSQSRRRHSGSPSVFFVYALLEMYYQ